MVVKSNNNVFHIEKSYCVKTNSIFEKIKLLFQLIININEECQWTYTTIKDFENIIKKVKENRLTYDNKYASDKYSGLCTQDLIERLQETAIEIEGNFEQITSKIKYIGWIFNLDSKRKQIHQVIVKINADVNFTRAKSCLSYEDNILEISFYLTFTEMNSLSQLSRNSQQQIRSVVTRLASDLGYRGSDFKEANTYLMTLFKETNAANSIGWQLVKLAQNLGYQAKDFAQARIYLKTLFRQAADYFSIDNPAILYEKLLFLNQLIAWEWIKLAEIQIQKKTYLY